MDSKKIVRSTCLTAVIFAMAANVSAASAAPTTFRLRAQRPTGSVDHVEATLEVSAEEKSDAKQTDLSKMTITAEVSYAERLLPPGDDENRSTRSIRRYDKADVLLKLGEKNEIRPVLAEDRRLVGVKIDASLVTFFSPSGPLTRDELDLLELHGAGMSLLAYRLLPDRPVAVKDTWKHDAKLMAAMLDLDSVSTSDVQSFLRQVAGQTAEVETSGHVKGTVDGVTTAIELKARYHFDLAAGRVTWFGMVARESRSAGQVEGAFDATSRLQIKIARADADAAASLSDAAIAGLTLTPGEAETLLHYDSPEGAWTLVHGRNWFLTRDEDRLAVFRLIDNGELVAQCNIHAMDDVKPENLATLAEFQEDVRQGLGDNFKEFIEASERPRDADCRIYRVVAAGEVEAIPIHWIYNTLATRDGRQVVLVFTVEGEHLEAFAAADEQLVAALRLNPIVQRPPRKSLE